MTNRTIWKISIAKLILWVLLPVSIIIVLLAIYGGNQLYYRSERHQRLDDCHFEVNHLQTKLYRLQELSDYVSILDQILTPLQMATLKAANEQIKRQKYKNYERYEMPLLNEKELKMLNRDR